MLPFSVGRYSGAVTVPVPDVELMSIVIGKGGATINKVCTARTLWQAREQSVTLLCVAVYSALVLYG